MNEDDLVAAAIVAMAHVPPERRKEVTARYCAHCGKLMPVDLVGRRELCSGQCYIDQMTESLRISFGAVQ